MARAPFQILVLPYRRVGDSFEYAVFRRHDDGCWQGLAGGGEGNETPDQAARREASEEAGLAPETELLALDAKCSVPVIHFRDSARWGESIYVIPEHSFGADGIGQELVLSSEHDRVEWLSYQLAYDRLTYTSNRTALWELNQRLHGSGPRGAAR